MTEPHADTDNKKSSASGMGLLLAIPCVIVQLIIFLFVVVATPIDVFRVKGKYATDPRVCYSMWGGKQCGAHKVYPDLTLKGFPCSSVRNTMNAAAAFAIISIFVTLVASVLCILLLCKCMPSMIAGIVGIVACITILISWACMAGAYHKKCKISESGDEYTSESISSFFNLYAGFALMVTGWCLQVIITVVIFFV